MPSFDIVSKVDIHELTNAVDQANRELEIRFDFKGTNAKFTLSKDKIELIAPSEFQLQQMDDILRTKLTKRNIDLNAMDYQPIQTNLSEARRAISVKQGISSDDGKKISKFIKESGVKVQPSIQGDLVRVTGKKRDDLQAVIALLRKAELEIALQYENFRD